MKKVVIAILVTLFVGSLLGCQNHDSVSAPQTPETMAQQFQGVIPCADCPGIKVSLSLQQGGRYTLNEFYLGSDNVQTTTQGRWTRTAEKLVLISEQGEKRYFRPLDNGLEMMDTEGNPIESVNSYRLAPVKS